MFLDGPGSITRTLPYSQTRPRSLRSRSTIIVSSARSFSLVASSWPSRRSSLGSPRPSARALDRSGCHPPSLRAKEQFRRRGDDREVAVVEERREGSGADAAKLGVQLRGGSVRLRRKPRREIHLIHLAREDVLLDPTDALGVRFRCEVGAQPRGAAWRGIGGSGGSRLGCLEEGSQ